MKAKTEYEKNCAHCEYSGEMYDEDYVLCSKKGVVNAAGVCRKFVYDPLKRKIQRRPPTPELEYIDINK